VRLVVKKIGVNLIQDLGLHFAFITEKTFYEGNIHLKIKASDMFKNLDFFENYLTIKMLKRKIILFIYATNVNPLLNKIIKVKLFLIITIKILIFYTL
jgi:hypothetical protein